MINALRFTEELEKAGFTAEQAKKSVDTWMSLMNDNFATKSDLRELQLINKSEFKDVRTDIRESSAVLRAEIKEVETVLRSEIREVETSLKTEIKEVETSLRKEISDVKTVLDKKIDYQTIRLGKLMLALVGASTAFLSFMISK